MSALITKLPPGPGEMETEICLPVRLRYRVDDADKIEVTHVAFADVECVAGPLLWRRLPLGELRSLEGAAREAAAEEGKR